MHQKPKIGPNDALRFLLEFFALFSLGFWGYLFAIVATISGVVNGRVEFAREPAKK